MIELVIMIKNFLILFLFLVVSCSNETNIQPKKLYLNMIQDLSPTFQQRIINSINLLNQEAGYELVSLSPNDGKPLIIYKYYSNNLFAHAEYRDYRCLIKIDETQPVMNNDLDLKYILLHEIGHCYGFIHTELKSNVMYPYYSGTTTSSEEDKNNIIFIMTDFLNEIRSIL